MERPLGAGQASTPPQSASSSVWGGSLGDGAGDRHAGVVTNPGLCGNKVNISQAPPQSGWNLDEKLLVNLKGPQVTGKGGVQTHSHRHRRLRKLDVQHVTGLCAWIEATRGPDTTHRVLTQCWGPSRTEIQPEQGTLNHSRLSVSAHRKAGTWRAQLQRTH